jgi:DNA-binding Xre family transcriptional regulator
MTTDIAPRQPADLNGKVAEEIRVAMLRRRMSGRQLATALDVSPTWISYRLTGQQAIGLDDLERIAGALNMPVRELLPEEVIRVRTTIALPPRPVDTRPPGHPGGSRAPVGPGRTGRTRRVNQPIGI